MIGSLCAAQSNFRLFIKALQRIVDQPGEPKVERGNTDQSVDRAEPTDLDSIWPADDADDVRIGAELLSGYVVSQLAELLLAIRIGIGKLDDLEVSHDAASCLGWPARRSC